MAALKAVKEIPKLTAAISRRPISVAGRDEKIPKGYVPMMLVGDQGDFEEERIMVPVQMLKEPRMAALLEMAAQRFGYGQPGVLRLLEIPCDAKRFHQMVGMSCLQS